ncbi:MAG: hypothetical protein IT460_09810 [Planctomycetes bacterium]|nr:hypothetical protein [Planctomycetota bacterium]
MAGLAAIAAALVAADMGGGQRYEGASGDDTPADALEDAPHATASRLAARGRHHVTLDRRWTSTPDDGAIDADAPESLDADRLRVWLSDDGGRSIEGAAVRVRPSDDGPPVLAATTAASGRVSLAPGSPPEDGWVVEATATGYATDRERVDADVARGGARVHLALRRVVVVEGRVRAPDGTAIVGAQVSAAGRGRGVHTGPGGRFEAIEVAVQASDAGPVATLEVDSPVGFRETTDVAVPADAQRLCVELTWPRHDDRRRIVGTVLGPDGRPAAGAVVRYVERFHPERAPGAGPDAGQAVCDAEGRYALRVPAYFVGCTCAFGIGMLMVELPGVGHACVWVPRPGGATDAAAARDDGAAPRAPAGDDAAATVLDLRLARLRRLDGSVVDANARGVANARVELRVPDDGAPSSIREGARARGAWPEDDEPDGPAIAATWTDERGAFTMPNVPERGDLALRALWDGTDRRIEPRDARPYWRAWCAVPTSAGPVRLTLPIDADAVLRESAVAAADEVRATDAEDAERSAKRARVRFQDGRGLAIALETGEVTAEVVGSGDLLGARVVAGALELEDVPSDGCRVRVAGESLSPVEVDLPADDRERGRGTRDTTVRLPRGGAVVVRVQVPEGLEGDDLEVRLEPEETPVEAATGPAERAAASGDEAEQGRATPGAAGEASGHASASVPEGAPANGERRGPRRLRECRDGTWRADRIEPGRYVVKVDMLDADDWELEPSATVDVVAGTVVRGTIALRRAAAGG